MALNALTNGTSTPVPADAGASSGSRPRKLKILMLHGFTQSGPLFHAKTRALEKSLQKAFPTNNKSSPLFSTYPDGIQLIYPTAPIRLHPADIPGFDTSAAQGADPESDAWGWWRKDSSTGTYIGLETGLAAIRDVIKDAGGIDGVIGFSQGGAAAAIVASLLDSGRSPTFEEIKKEVPDALDYPEGWEGLQDEGKLRFAVSYSGFYAPDRRYRAFYEPRIRTPVLSFVGSLDSVVDESRSLGLVERCEGKEGEKGRVVFHPGGHFVPVGKEWVGVLVGFIRECCAEQKKEESVENMDLPASFL